MRAKQNRRDGNNNEINASRTVQNSTIDTVMVILRLRPLRVWKSSAPMLEVDNIKKVVQHRSTHLMCRELSSALLLKRGSRPPLLRNKHQLLLPA